MLNNKTNFEEKTMSITSSKKSIMTQLNNALSLVQEYFFFFYWGFFYWSAGLFTFEKYAGNYQT